MSTTENTLVMQRVVEDFPSEDIQSAFEHMFKVVNCKDSFPTVNAMPSYHEAVKIGTWGAGLGPTHKKTMLALACHTWSVLLLIVEKRWDHSGKSYAHQERIWDILVRYLSPMSRHWVLPNTSCNSRMYIHIWDMYQKTSRTTQLHRALERMMNFIDWSSAANPEGKQPGNFRPGKKQNDRFLDNDTFQELQGYYRGLCREVCEHARTIDFKRKFRSLEAFVMVHLDVAFEVSNH